MKFSFKEFLQSYAELEEAVMQAGEDGTLIVEDNKVSGGGLTPDMARKVYHRDYLTTKDKPYRKYNAQKRARQRRSK